eukprot:6189149-Pleurochrysis_carterae.AAC.1
MCSSSSSSALPCAAAPGACKMPEGRGFGGRPRFNFATGGRPGFGFGVGGRPGCGFARGGRPGFRSAFSGRPRLGLSDVTAPVTFPWGESSGVN